MIPTHQIIGLMIGSFIILFMSIMLIFSIIYPSYKEIVTLGDPSMQNCAFKYCKLQCNAGDYNYEICLCPEGAIK